MLHCEGGKVRAKLQLFLEARGPSGVVEACRRAGKAPRFYYYWWHRYRSAGLRWQALLERSRRPKHSPRKTSSEIEARVLRLAEDSGETPEKIRRQLETEHKIQISSSTVYRILRHRRKSQTRRPGPAKISRRSISTVSGLAAPQAILPLRLLAGRYELLSELGRGGAGIVYLARDRQGGAQVAVKTLDLRTAARPELIEAFQNEFRTLSALRHPHLARVYDFGATDEELYFSSEYLPIGDILGAAGSRNLNTVLRWLVQVLGALDFLHGRGILHLDLKPSNILLGTERDGHSGGVKLIDFGTAAWIRHGAGSLTPFFGTPPYAAPEVLLETAPSPASDLYSFGMLCYRLLCGKFPFEDLDAVAMMKEQIYGEPNAAVVLPQALPEDFSQILAKLTARDPRERFSSARGVLAAFNACLGENFSLREPSTPARILDSSERKLRPELFKELLREMTRTGPQVVVISGPPGSGKRRLLREVKTALQLRGLHPRSCEAEDWDEIVADHPLLFSAERLGKQELVAALDLLEGHGVPVLVSTECSASPELNPHRWLQLEALTPSQLGSFLDAEITDCPSALVGDLYRLCAGEAPRLEQTLRALREFGHIQWSDRGWHWVGSADARLEDLLDRHEALWRQRGAEIRRLLGGSDSGLDAKTLAGIFQLDREILGEQLDQWTQQGLFRCKRLRKTTVYLSAGDKTKDSAPSLRQDIRLLDELTSLYRQGRYAAGTAWIQWLEKRATPEHPLHEPVAIHGARHLVAVGLAEEALRLLPAKGPKDPALHGLYYEIQSRAALARGELKAATKALDLAWKAYRRDSDPLGTSRIANLRALVAKRCGETEEAEREFLASIEWAREGGDAYHEAMSRMNLALLDHDQGRWERCQIQYRAAFALEREIGQPLLSCKLRENWINLLLYLGKTDEAETTCYELLKISLQAGYPEQQAAALNALALIAGQRGETARRLAHLEQALSILDPVRHPQPAFQCRLDRGLVQFEAKKFTAAQLDAEAAWELGEKNTNPTWIALAQLLLGRVLRDRPRPDLVAATRALNLSHHEAWKLGIRPLLWEIDWERALLARKKGENSRSRNYLLSAHQTLKELLEILPPALRQSHLRDRKLERIEAELKDLEKILGDPPQLYPNSPPKK